MVDVARGWPAHGMRVEISRLSPMPRLIAEGQLDAGGTLPHAIIHETLLVGTYEVPFDADAFFAGAELNLTDPPLKITPWGFCRLS